MSKKAVVLSVTCKKCGEIIKIGIDKKTLKKMMKGLKNL